MSGVFLKRYKEIIIMMYFLFAGDFRIGGQEVQSIYLNQHVSAGQILSYWCI